MNTQPARYDAAKAERARRAIILLATKTEEALKCATICESEPTLAHIAPGWRRLAAMEAANAFKWTVDLT